MDCFNNILKKKCSELARRGLTLLQLMRIDYSDYAEYSDCISCNQRGSTMPTIPSTRTNSFATDAYRISRLFCVLGLTLCFRGASIYTPKKMGRSALYLGCNSCNGAWFTMFITSCRCWFKVHRLRIFRRNNLCFSLKAKIAPEKFVILAENVIRWTSGYRPQVLLHTEQPLSVTSPILNNVTVES